MKSNNCHVSNISYEMICFHCIPKLLIDSAILYFVYHVHKLHFPSVTFWRENLLAEGILRDHIVAWKRMPMLGDVVWITR